MLTVTLHIQYDLKKLLLCNVVSNFRFHFYLLDLMLGAGKFVTVDTVRFLETS